MPSGHKEFLEFSDCTAFLNPYIGQNLLKLRAPEANLGLLAAFWMYAILFYMYAALNSLENVEIFEDSEDIRFDDSIAAAKSLKAFVSKLMEKLSEFENFSLKHKKLYSGFRQLLLVPPSSGMNHLYLLSETLDKLTMDIVELSDEEGAESLNREDPRDPER